MANEDQDNVTTSQRVGNSDGEYIPVNKGHFEMDTKARIHDFHEKLSKGWEGEYKEYRKAWEFYPRNKEVRDYPILVDMELASNCNLTCAMCYTVTDEFKASVKRKLMDFELYKKVVDQVAGKIFALRLSWRGESTLHNKFIEAVSYAKMKGIKEVSFLTNGSMLTLDYFKKLAEAGADWITVSFDGLEEEYNKIRQPLTYKETLEKLRDIHEFKKNNCLEKPVIKVQGVWPAIRKDPEKFYNTLAKVTDLVAFNPLIDYLGKDSNIIYEENFTCPQIYERMFVSSTGEVMMCCADGYGEEVVGDANQESIHEIWHGEKLQRIRGLHNKKNGFLEVPICGKCYYPRKTEVDEVANINGRSILVENYINRKQVIGE